MQGTALIVEIERAMVVVSIGVRSSRFEISVPVGSDRRRLIHIEGVLVDQRNNSPTCATTKSASSDARRQRIVCTNIIGV